MAPRSIGWLAAVVSIVTACAPTPNSETPGVARIALAISSGVTLSAVGYAVTGPGNFSRAGSVDVSTSGTVTFLVGGLPAANGFMVGVTAASLDGTTSCAGNAMFNVAAGSTTDVPVQIDCHQAPTTGSISVNGTINVCPAIQMLNATPMQVPVGGQLALSATAVDLDGGPAALTYSWSATAGSFGDSSNPMTSFTCATAGIQTVTLVVSDGDASPGCAATQSISVVCQQPQPMCSFSSPPPPPAVTVTSVEDYATATELATYDALIGRFLRGDVTVYRGTMSAQATAAYQAQASIPAGPALALLDIRGTIGGDWLPPRNAVPSGSQTAVLVVHSLPSRLYVAYAQDTEDTGVTWSGYIRSDNPAAGLSDNVLDRSCPGCGPSFWARPNDITFDGLVTSGSEQQYNPVTGTTNVPVSTTTSLQLTVAAPCSLAWQDLAILDTATGPNEFAAGNSLGLTSFHPDGTGLLVSNDIGAYTPYPIASGTCGLVIYYAADLWVDSSDLSNHGVRNFNITSMQTQCVD
jgi:hypothetical protein